jgi:hypothetical protein
VAIAGAMSVAINAIREQLAASAAFQSWTGGDAAASLALIYRGRLPAREAWPDRFVGIRPAETQPGSERVGVRTLLPRGAVELGVFGRVAADNRDDGDAAELDATNAASEFLDALRAAAAIATNGFFVSFDIVSAMGPAFLDFAELDTDAAAKEWDRWELIVNVEWGL